MKKKKNRVAKNFIRFVKKRNKQTFFKMTQIRLQIVFFILIVVVLIVSYIFGDTWFAGVMQSFAVGIITGWIVYILGNVRNQVGQDVCKKVEQLEALYKKLLVVYNSIPDKAIIVITKHKYDTKECIETAINAAREYIEAIKRLDITMLEELFRNVENTNFDNLEVDLDRIYEKYIDNDEVKVDMHAAKMEIIKVISEVSNWIEDELDKAKNQQRQLCKHPL
ncbi:MAG: hypothetical protein E7262_00525 [Lachnospiraceae bacterium]|nr:hypothetical protein [Lachnospiraceae bacterium]